MDFALNSIVLFCIFIIPGFIYRKFYFSGLFSDEFYKSNYFSVFLSTLFPSLIIHIFFYEVVDLISIWEIDFLLIFKFFDTWTVDNISVFTETIENQLHLFYCYSFSLIIFSAICGILTKAIVRNLKLDRKLRFFRYKNFWYYILTGEVLDFPHIIGQAKNIGCKYIDLVVSIDSETLIYRGILADYHLSKENCGLEFIVLKEAKRRNIRPRKRWVQIPGDFLVIPYSSVININIAYISIYEIN